MFTFDDRLKFYAGSLTDIEKVSVIIRSWRYGFLVPGNFYSPECKQDFIPTGFSSHDRGLFLQYLYDAKDYFTHLDPSDRVLFRHGDVNFNLPYPGVCKTRRAGALGGAVLLKLNARRHWNEQDFRDVREHDLPFMEKRSSAVWRGITSGKWPRNDGKPKEEQRSPRASLVLKWKDNHDWLDIGITKFSRNILQENGELNAEELESYVRPPLPIKEQLEHRYILMPEGKDVATGLKWALRSNSVVVMPQPTISSWLMEERLKPWVHYVPVKSDFSDLHEKILYCESNLSEVKSIPKNANNYSEMFDNVETELELNRALVSMLVKKAKYKMDKSALSKPSSISCGSSLGHEGEFAELAITMPAEPKEYLTQKLASVRYYMEFGAGGSTIQALRSPALKHVISVESDGAFAARVRASAPDDVRLSLIYADVGPVREWGVPSRPSQHFAKFHAYIAEPWARARELGIVPDFILVDGRFRVASFLMSYLCAAPGTEVMFDDYVNRPHYHLVEQYVERHEEKGRAAIFIMPKVKDIIGATSDLMKYSINSQ